jgi:hypothetical protein
VYAVLSGTSQLLFHQFLSHHSSFASSSTICFTHSSCHTAPPRPRWKAGSSSATCRSAENSGIPVPPTPGHNNGLGRRVVWPRQGMPLASGSCTWRRKFKLFQVFAESESEYRGSAADYDISKGPNLLHTFAWRVAERTKTVLVPGMCNTSNMRLCTEPRQRRLKQLIYKELAMSC